MMVLPPIQLFKPVVELAQIFFEFDPARLPRHRRLGDVQERRRRHAHALARRCSRRLRPRRCQVPETDSQQGQRHQSPHQVAATGRYPPQHRRRRPAAAIRIREFGHGQRRGPGFHQKRLIRSHGSEPSPFPPFRPPAFSDA